MKFSNIIERLKPARWRKAPELTAHERMVSWKQVAPGDPCLRAVVDLLGEMLEQNANVSMDMRRSGPERMAGADAAGITRGILFAIEDEWQTARAELQNKTLNPEPLNR